MTTSARDITIPVGETSIFEDMQALVNAAGRNKNEKAIVLCIACMEAGWNTRSQIIETGIRCQLNNGHVAKILETGIGVHWRLDGACFYSVID